MKTKLAVIKLMLVLGVGMIPFISKADWKTKAKDTRICVGYRWWAHSQVVNLNVNKIVDQQTNSVCKGETQAYTRYGPQSGNHAAAQAWRSGSRNQGWAFTNLTSLLPGVDANALFQKSILSEEDENTYGTHNISNDMEFEFKEDNDVSRRVRASFLDGYMLIKNTEATDYYSTYDIIIWRSQSETEEEEENEEITSNKIAWRSTITLSKEGVVGTGIFADDSNYELLETDSGTLVVFHLEEEIDITLSETSDHYIIYTKGHIGYNYNGNSYVKVLNNKDMDRLEVDNLKTYNLKEFAIFPNPSSSKVNFELTPTVDAEVEIELYDLRGQLIKSVYKGVSKSNEKLTIEYLKSNNIPAGQYQMKCKINGETFCRPIMIE